MDVANGHDGDQALLALPGLILSGEHVMIIERSLEPALPRTIVLTDPDQFNDIREGVRAVCAEFPDEYHRKIDHDRTYPEAFVAALFQGLRDGCRPREEDLRHAAALADEVMRRLTKLERAP